MIKGFILIDNSLKGNYGQYSTLEPIPLNNGTFFIPERILHDAEFSTIHEQLNQLPIIEITENDLLHVEE